MTFSESLASLQRDHEAMTGPHGSRTVSQLLDYAMAYRHVLRGRAIAIHAGDPIRGIECLLAADGNARSLTLLPPTLDDHLLLDLFNKAGCDLLLSPCSRTRSLLPATHVAASLEDIPDHSLAADEGPLDTRWCLATSGTTTIPKLVSHTFRSLTRTVRRPPHSEPIARWGLLYDYTRFAGLQVVLQSLISGSHLIALTADMPLRQRLDSLAEQRCTHLSATPALWRAILMMPQAMQLPLAQITIGGEIADARLLTTLRSAFPTARITHIYASTEAGVGFSVNDGVPGFPASYLDKGPGGVQVRIVHSRLEVRNTEVDSAYVGTDHRFQADDGWIDTGDVVERAGDRYHFIGRASGVINVGGNKVHPEEIERILVEFPGIREARVFGKRSSLMGSVVAAEVVPMTLPKDPSALCRDILSYLRSRTEPFKVPAQLTLVETIGRTPTGKVSRGNAT